MLLHSGELFMGQLLVKLYGKIFPKILAFANKNTTSAKSSGEFAKSTTEL
jgi:hypothetical protein